MSTQTKRYVILLFFLTLLIPIYFDFFSLLLTPSRLFLLAVCPYLVLQMFKGPRSFSLPDFFLLLYIFWILLSVLYYNTSVALTFVGSNGLMILGGYLVGKTAVCNESDFRFMTLTYLFFVALSLPFAIAEAVTPNQRTTPNMVVPGIIEMIGLESEKDVLYEPRFGIDRAQVVFPHPIHYGFFCSGCVALVYAGLRLRKSMFFRSIGGLLCVFSCFLSVSSGPFLSAVFQFLLILFERVFGWVKSRWYVAGIAILFVFALSSIFMQGNPLRYVTSAVVFSSHTTYVRWILLEYGIQQVLQTPVLGVGFYTKWNLPGFMSGSVDNMWLLAAVHTGLPSFLFLALTFLCQIRGALRTVIPSNSEAFFQREAWTILQVSVILTMATVALWNQVYTLVFFLLGAGSWFSNRELFCSYDQEDEGGDDGFE
jgi:hypothetical protein